MTSAASILARALMAVGLMIGFYVLAVAIAGGLLYIPYADFAYAHRIHPKIFMVCVVGALAILAAILPRLDKFPAPGPRLAPAQHPRLFEELEKVAQATRQAMPAEVYLVPDVNAWVAQRGGIMGLGSRRVMGLGLPLMRALTRSQFRAVLAHEFGHYHGGDTKVGPWIYKTRGALGRTLASLGNGTWLQAPFLWYGKMFLRITHAISRRQEFIADELAARAVGARPLTDGLRRIHGVAPAFNSYWRHECAPVLDAGFVPPLVEGFETFMQASHIAQAIDQHVEEELQTGKTNPYDTHPPLKERIAAVAHLPAGENPPNDPPALSLLENIPALEAGLLTTVAGAEAARKLKPIAWKEVGVQVYLSQWKQLARSNAEGLKGITPDSLPGLAADLRTLGKRFVDYSGDRPNDEAAASLAGGVIGSALCVLLIGRGGKVQAVPGQRATVSLNGVEVEPFNLLAELAEAKTTAAATWLQQSADLCIQGVDLGSVTETAGVSAPSPSV